MKLKWWIEFTGSVVLSLLFRANAVTAVTSTSFADLTVGSSYTLSSDPGVPTLEQPVFGSGVLIQSGHRFFVVTASHVSQGQRTWIRLSEKNIPIVRRLADNQNDIEIFEIADPQVPALVIWNGQDRRFETDLRWKSPRQILQSSTNQDLPVSWLFHGEVQLSRGKWTKFVDSTFLLVTKALREAGEPAAQLLSSTYNSPTKEIFSGMVSLMQNFTGQWVAKTSIRPGMSGAPLFRGVQESATWREKNARYEFIGLASQYDRIRKFSLFSSAEPVRDLLLQIEKNPRDPWLDGTRWQMSKYGTYRVYPDGSSEMLEGKGHASSVFFGDRAGHLRGDGTGHLRGDGGAHLRADGGESSPLPLVDEWNEVSPFENPEILEKLRHARSLPLGFFEKGKEVEAFSFRNKKTGQVLYLEASSSSFGLKKKLKGEFEVTSIFNDLDWVQTFREKVQVNDGKTFGEVVHIRGSESVRQKTEDSLVVSQNQIELQICENSSAPCEPLVLTCDKHGQFQSASADILQPFKNPNSILVVRSRHSGKSFILDLRNFFLNDVSLAPFGDGRKELFLGELTNFGARVYMREIGSENERNIFFYGKFLREIGE